MYSTPIHGGGIHQKILFIQPLHVSLESYNENLEDLIAHNSSEDE